MSCRATQTIVENKEEDYRSSKSETVRIDSVKIFERDSVIVKMKADTVWLEKYVYRFKDRIKTDTFYYADTVIVNRKEFVHTIEKPSLWEQIKSVVTWIIVGIVLGFLIRIIIKKML